MKLIYTTLTDAELLVFICENDDRKAFAELYQRYFSQLFNYTYSKVNDRFAAQEVVQELFVSLWLNRQSSAISSCRIYLFSALKKSIISYYRKEYTRKHHYDQYEGEVQKSLALTDQATLVDDLQTQYDKELHAIPPKCREVFVMSRSGIPRKDIALQLDISEKTVEQHITKALKILKDRLREHLPYLLATLFFH